MNKNNNEKNKSNIDDDLFFANLESEQGKRNNYNAPQQKQTTGSKIMSVIFSVLLSIIIYVAGFLTSYLTVSKPDKFTSWAVDIINSHSIFATGTVTSDQLLKLGIKGALNDEYALIYTPEETAAFFNNLQSGITKNFGMSVANTVTTNEIFTTIVAVTGNSPCENAGVEIFSRIYKIGKKGEALTDCYNFSTEEVTIEIDKIGIDEIMELVLVRPSAYTVDGGFVYNNNDPSKVYTVEVKREEYVEKSVYYYDNTNETYADLPDDVGYIKLKSFMGNSGAQFANCINEFKNNNKTKLILDLRDNGGGADVNLRTIASYLLKSGNLTRIPILIEIFKGGVKSSINTVGCYYDDFNFEDIVILQNENSASAAEALIAAMKDYGTVSKIIGTSTFGKGIGQTTYVMPTTNYAIKMTTMQFVSPVTYTSHDRYFGAEVYGISPTEGYLIENSFSYPYEIAKDLQFQAALGCFSN